MPRPLFFSHIQCTQLHPLLDIYFVMTSTWNLRKKSLTNLPFNVKCIPLLYISLQLAQLEEVKFSIFTPPQLWQSVFSHLLEFHLFLCLTSLPFKSWKYLFHLEPHLSLSTLCMYSVQNNTISFITHHIDVIKGQTWKVYICVNSSYTHFFMFFLCRTFFQWPHSLPSH